MNGTIEADEAYDPEYDESSDEGFEEGYEEARPTRRPNLRPVPTAPRASAFRPRTPAAATQGFVTQAQLKKALEAVASNQRITNKAITTLDGRVRAASAEQGRLAMALRKEMAERKKDSTGARSDLQSKGELFAVASLLLPPAAAQYAPLTFFLPPNISTGLLGGSSTNSGQSMFGGDGSNMLVLLIAVAAASGWIR